MVLFLAACSPEVDLTDSTVLPNAGEREVAAPGDHGQSEAESSLIYGTDDRREVFEVSAAEQILATSTVAVVSTGQLRSTSGGYNLDVSSTFGADANLCPGEPYANQPDPAFCSGFQVGDDLIVTAGHCIQRKRDCRSTAFVFDFDMTSSNTVRSTFASDDVYFCDSIVARVETGTNDWAVIRVDRPINGHGALPLRRSGSVGLGDSVTLIGHPYGLPTKVAGNATVRANGASSYFEANVDAYGGNSGSAVFNTVTHEVEGILVRGNADLVSNGSCNVSNQCPDTGCPDWEEITRISQVLPYVPVTDPDPDTGIDPDPDTTPPIGGCDNDGVCETGESCDGRQGTTACGDCNGRSNGRPSNRFCEVADTCEGPGC
jgi:hypothetical protein